MREPRTEPRRRQPREVRRAQILTAALGCFGAKGYHAATMDDLVRASGLSKGSLYWHFESKEQVLLALFDAFEDELYEAWEATAEGAASTGELMERLGEVTLERFEAERALLFTWIEFLAHPAARERMARSYGRARTWLADQLRRDRDAGTLRELPASGLATVIIAVFEGLVLQTVVDPDFQARVHWPVALEVLRSGAWA